MQLTGKQITDLNIFTNYCNKGIQQQGLDLRLESVGKLNGIGVVRESSTSIPQTNWLRPTKIYVKDKEGGGEIIDAYDLEPGYYEVKLVEGCKIPANMAVVLKTRSSLVRCGADVRSGQFDAGFTTEQMGCYLVVERHIVIEKNARICQALVQETLNVDKNKLYSGQFQGDVQR